MTTQHAGNGTASVLRAGQASLGIELGSTRIKAVLIGPDHAVLATGSHAWENQFVEGRWTYDLAEVWSGLQAGHGRRPGRRRDPPRHPTDSVRRHRGLRDDARLPRLRCRR